MGNLKIGTRLTLAFTMTFICMLVIGCISIAAMSQLQLEVDTLATDRYPKVIMLQNAKDHLNVIARSLRNMLLVESKEELAKELRRVAESRESIAKIFSELQKVVKSDKGKALLKDVLEKRAAYVKSYVTLMKLIDKGDRAGATRELLTSVRMTQAAYFQSLDKMVEYQSEGVEISARLAQEMSRSRRIITLAVLALALVVSVVSTTFIVKSITVPVAQLVTANDRLASKDLTVTIDLQRNDEIGQLAESSRRVIASLRQVLRQVSDTSGQIASASIQLQSTAEQIATGAEEVASQTSTVATASQEMAATSSEIAANCSAAADASQQSSESAANGGAIVQETISGMRNIAERVKSSACTIENLGARSEQIGAIIGTIEDIADQTNLLALNAAIEAARAGEQGRGFAVVADEVRALAERTTKATKEISEMIKAVQCETKIAVRSMEEGVHEVERGMKSSQRSGEALQTILLQISEVAMQINQIATAAEQQTATTAEITMNVQQVTDVVHETARGAGETASASSQLASSAQILEKLVGQFRL